MSNCNLFRSLCNNTRFRNSASCYDNVMLKGILYYLEESDKKFLLDMVQYDAKASAVSIAGEFFKGVFNLNYDRKDVLTAFKGFIDY